MPTTSSDLLARRRLFSFDLLNGLPWLAISRTGQDVRANKIAADRNAPAVNSLTTFLLR
jgi:hypothetical protein